MTRRPSGREAAPASTDSGPVSPDSEARPAPAGCVLAIETSWRIGSVALALDGRVVARRFLARPREHGARLAPSVEELLKAGDAALGDVEAIVVGAGPGSFTGVRTGAAVAKALAAALAVPLHAASSLAAAALAPEVLAGAADDLPPEFPGAAARPESPAAEIRYVLFDARGGRIYGACYRVDDAVPVAVTPPHGGTIVDVVNRRPPRGTVFAGEGALAHEQLLRAAGHAVAPPPAGFAIADALLLCCDWPPVSVADWEPDYVREWKPG